VRHSLEGMRGGQSLRRAANPQARSASTVRWSVPTADQAATTAADMVTAARRRGGRTPSISIKTHRRPSRRGSSSSNALMVEDSSEEEEAGGEERTTSSILSEALQCFVGKHDLGDCDVRWEPGAVCLLKDGDEIVRLPSTEITLLCANTSFRSPMVFLKTSLEGELFRRFKDDYQAGEDLVVLAFSEWRKPPAGCRAGEEGVGTRTPVRSRKKTNPRELRTDLGRVLPTLTVADLGDDQAKEALEACVEGRDDADGVLEKILGAKAPPSTGSPLRRRSLRRKTRSGGRIGSDDSGRRLFTYPPGADSLDVVTITAGDRERLAPGEYLNDNIVDWYLKVLQSEAPPRETPSSPDRRGQVHFFSSHFFTKLTKFLARAHGSRRRRDVVTGAYEQVRRWTKNFDLFSKRFVFIPIVEHLHWSLAVVANLDLLEQRAVEAAARQRGEERVHDEEGTTRGEEEVAPATGRQPCIIFLDSLRCHAPSRVARAIREYLAQEWRAKKLHPQQQPPPTQQEPSDSQPENAPSDGGAAHTSSNEASQAHPVLDFIAGLRVLQPHAPLQENGSDCGVFALQYAEQIFATWPEVEEDHVESGTLDGLGPETFSQQDITAKRGRLLKMMNDLARRSPSSIG